MGYLYRYKTISVHCPSDFTFCITVRLSSTMFNSQSKGRIFHKNGPIAIWRLYIQFTNYFFCTSLYRILILISVQFNILAISIFTPDKNKFLLLKIYFYQSLETVVMGLSYL